jgi:hypothetical protein
MVNRKPEASIIPMANFKPTDPDPEANKRVFIRARGKHRNQFYGLVYVPNSDHIAVKRLVDNNNIRSEQLVNIPDGDIESYARDRGFKEVTEEVKKQYALENQHH